MNNNDKSAVERPAKNESTWKNATGLGYGTSIILVLAQVLIFWATCNSPKTLTTTSSSSEEGGAERMVLDNEQVTVYVKCTNREEKQYSFRFVVKKPGSPLIAPIMERANNLDVQDVHSVIVDGVDRDTQGFAFNLHHTILTKKLEFFAVSYGGGVLSGSDPLGNAYHDLVLKYEGGLDLSPTPGAK